MSHPNPKCLDCRRPSKHWGLCDPCKALSKLLTVLHLGCERHQPGKELRVELYRVILERGGRLFE